MQRITKEMKMELYFRTRKIEGQPFDFKTLFDDMRIQCERINNKESFNDSEELISFLRKYAFIRDLSAAEKIGKLEKNCFATKGITDEVLSKCKEIVDSVEKHKEVIQGKLTLFYQEGRYGKAQFEEFFSIFSIKPKQSNEYNPR